MRPEKKFGEWGAEGQPDPFTIAPARDPQISHNNNRYLNDYGVLNAVNREGSIDSLMEKYCGEDRGMALTENGYISQDVVHPGSNGVMFGAAVVRRRIVTTDVTEGSSEFEMIPAAIVETNNQSFRYVTENPDTKLMEDIGPVSHVCFVGGHTRPSHILVPLTEPQAVKDAQYILDHFGAMHEKVKEMHEELPKAPFEEEDDNHPTNIRPRRIY